MSKKHFEDLARLIAVVCTQFKLPEDSDCLRNLLVYKMWEVCEKHNPNFDWVKFEERVKDLISEMS